MSLVLSSCDSSPRGAHCVHISPDTHAVGVAQPGNRHVDLYCCYCGEHRCEEYGTGANDPAKHGSFYFHLPGRKP